MTQLTSVDDALALVLSRIVPGGNEEVSIEEADGRVLAEAAEATVDLPPFPSSSMDGYAVRAADTPTSSGPLQIVAHVAAGRPTPLRLEAGAAIGIATGGVVPEGADAVVPLELVEVVGRSLMIPTAVALNANIRARGGDVTAGTPIAAAAEVVTPSLLAALAASGVATVRCVRRPSVAIVTTGTELRAAGEPLAPGQIYESNGPMLAALFRRAGAVVSLTRAVADDPDAHRVALRAAVAAADIVVTSGGVSVGPHDLVRPTLADLGVSEVFWGVSMRPGKPLLFACRERTLVFGLPGNPVSSLVGALLFVVPAIRGLQRLSPGPHFGRGVAAVDIPARPERDDFPRAVIQAGEDGPALVPLRGQESHMIVASARADAIVRVPAGSAAILAGAPVDYLRLDGSSIGV